MARKKRPDEEEEYKHKKYDFTREHIRGIYIERERFPVYYAPPIQIHISLSFPSFRSRPFEAVVKIVSHIKETSGVLRAMRYLAEKSEGLTETRPLYDEESRLLTPEKFQEKIKELPEPSHKNGRRMAHIVVSFPKAARMTTKKTERFMEKYMEAFAERGFKFVYCAHVHQSTVHGHVLLCETNGREHLRFGKKELMMLRQHQAEIAKEFGLNMQASYCNKREIDITGRTAKPKRKTLLERQVPEWFKRRKTKAERELPFGITPEPKRYQINETAQQTLDEWAKHFEEPERAKQLFIKMYAENKRTAFWYAKNNAKVFGETEKPRPSSFPTSKRFKLTTAEIARIRPEKAINTQRGIEREIER
ncbi:MAG: relaxase/mobilization nuclease domain-containing protein [Alphaproteobacteria bacterium]|nr:relaxase/mobilization nuclease domain-containing protein [Alphaproteobacteria bacterium]